MKNFMFDSIEDLEESLGRKVSNAVKYGFEMGRLSKIKQTARRGHIKKGDRVLVWSSQSFFGGGFLEAEPAFARQNSNGKSVILCVVRKFDGVDKIDDNYEVYAKQVEVVSKHRWDASKELRDFRKKIMKNKLIT